MNSARTAPPSRGRQGTLFEQAEQNGFDRRGDEGRTDKAQLIVPRHQKQHILCPRIPTLQRRVFADWRQQQANQEWRRFVDRELPTCSVDGYKDVPHRKRTLHGYGVEEARKQGGNAVREKKERLRKKWRLPKWRDIRVRSHGRRVR